mgnify:CR=1 FL=1
MSNVSKNILQEIDTVLDNINTKLIQFQSLYNRETREHEYKNVSNILKLLNKTKNIYTWTQENGSFSHTNHSTSYQDVMSKWSALIDDLYWSIFGFEFIFVTKIENRLKIIYLKLCEIDSQLKTCTPNIC